MTENKLNLIPNPSIKGREYQYRTVEVDLDKIVTSWKMSIFSFEWLTPQGTVRKPYQLSDFERQKYETVLSDFQNSKALPQPILGIGVMNNVEIGSRRDILLTLYSQNIKKLKVHVPKSNLKDFESFL